MTLSPDGRTLVFVSQGPGGVPSLYRRRSDEVDVTPIPGTEHASDPEFSPDGRWVVFVQNRLELKRMPVEGGAPLDVSVEGGASGDDLTAGSILEEPSWGTDGSILFVAQGGLYQVPAEGGPAERILRTPQFSSRLPRLVVGTGRVLFTHQPFASMDPEVRLLDLGSREVMSVVRGSDGRFLAPGHLIYAALDGSMVAAPFDPEEGALTGTPTLIDHVGMGPAGQARMHFAVAASGSAVYAVGSLGGFAEVLVTVGLDGSEDPIRGLPVGNYSGPRYDPTGRHIAFEMEGTLFVRDLVLGSQNPLHEENAYNPIWSRDGSRIAFGRWLPSRDSKSQLLVRPVDLSSEAEVVLESSDFVPPSAWSAADSLIVFSAVEQSDGSGAEIWYAPSTRPAAPRPFLRADGWDQGFASLSPDGRWLAYESDVSGRDAVYVQSFPIPGERRKVSEGGGIGARWAADGGRIFYRSGDTVKVAHVRTAPDFAVVSHETLFTGPYEGIDPHPDGTRVVAIKRLQARESAQDRRLFWVVNWLDDVRERLEGG
jgi:serine/threonine-protein kinase